ncbi:hypothetical protein BDV40DRAFT_294163 [Aspergillus tamarii]|uniref:Uncharacterized protein n=1 Tax=Aspergillus tamarii TaxID=41984 RepID=A0A5N6UAQ0_ASPTM|nr:hypothetical protein BDV40DRAFT_294163 [Aspergillus tamarii]
MDGNIFSIAKGYDLNPNRDEFPVQSGLEKLKLNADSIHKSVDSKLEVELQTRILTTMPDYQVSDATISKNFLVACDSLCGWVGGFSDIKSFTEALYDAVHHRGIDENILIFPREFQLELDHAQKHILEPLVVAAPPADQELLGHIYGMMSMLEPGKRACTATQVYNDKIIQCCFGLAEYLRGLFSYFSCEETVDLDQKLGRLEQQILPQIAVLALRMKCSPEQYWWDGDRDFDWTQPIIVYKSYLTARFANMQDDVPIGVALLGLYSALFRSVPGTQNDVLIQKAAVVIQGYESLPPNLKA